VGSGLIDCEGVMVWLLNMFIMESILGSEGGKTTSTNESIKSVPIVCSLARVYDEQTC